MWHIFNFHKKQRSKLDPCVLRGVFLGYAAQQKVYRCIYPPTQRMYVTLDVTFLESDLYFPDPVSISPRYGETQNLSTLEDRKICCWTTSIDRSSPVDRSPRRLHHAITFSTKPINRPDPSDRSLGTFEDSHKLIYVSTYLEDEPEQAEDPHSHSSISADQSPKNILEVNTLTTFVNLVDDYIGYKLHFRENYGKPPNWLSPYIGKTLKSPIVNHVQLKYFLNQSRISCISCVLYTFQPR